MYDFDTDKNIKLTNEFMGVMITWTVSIDNYEIWKTIRPSVTKVTHE